MDDVLAALKLLQACFLEPAGVQDLDGLNCYGSERLKQQIERDIRSVVSTASEEGWSALQQAFWWNGFELVADILLSGKNTQL